MILVQEKVKEQHLSFNFSNSNTIVNSTLPIKNRFSHMPDRDEENAKQLASQLLKGKPVSIVPYEIINKVSGILTIKKSEEIQKGNVQKVQVIQKLLEGLAALTKTGHRNAARVTTGMSRIPPSELDPIIENFINGGKLELSHKLYIPDLIARVQFIKSELIKLKELEQAQIFENAYQKLLIYNQESNLQMKKYKKRDEVVDQLENAKKELESAKLNFIKAMDDFDNDYKNEESSIISEHRQRLREFDERTSRGIPPSMKKFSSSYLNYREQQKQLVSLKRYAEASEIKAIADELEQKELNQIQAHFELKRLKERKKIVEENQKMLNVFRDSMNSQKQKLISDNETTIAQKERTVENIEKRLKDAQNSLQKDIRQSSLGKSNADQTLKNRSIFQSQINTQPENKPQLIDVETQTKLCYRFPPKVISK